MPTYFFFVIYAATVNNEINQKIPFDLRQIDIRMIRLRLVVAVVLLTFCNFSTTFQSPCSRKRHGFIILPLTLEKRVRSSRCSAYLVRFPKNKYFLSWEKEVSNILKSSNRPTIDVDDSGCNFRIDILMLLVCSSQWT